MFILRLNPYDSYPLDAFAPGEQERLRAVIAEVVRTKQPLQLELKRGEQWFLCEVALEGAELLIVGLMITERKELEEKLLASEERYRGVFEQAPYAVATYSFSGELLSCNPTWQRIWMVPDDKLAEFKRSFNLRTYEPFRRMGIETIFEAVNHGKTISTRPLRVVSHISEKGPRELWVEGHFYPIKDLAGRVQEIVVANNDVTEREESISLLRGTLDATADGIVVVDNNRVVRAFNKRFLELWKIPPEMALDGLGYYETLNFVLPQLKSPEICIRRLEEVFQTPECESFDVLDFVDGRSFERVSRPQQKDGKIRGRVFSYRDVTEARRSRETIEGLYAEAQEAVRLRDDFILLASHELRTPLTPLRAHLQMMVGLLRRAGISPQGEGESLYRAVVSAQEQSTRLMRLIEDMLDATRLSSGKLAMKKELLELGPLLEEILAENAGELEIRGCVVRLSLAPGVFVFADRRRLSQAITGLLSNAMKFGAGRSIDLTLERSLGHAVLSVRDFGIGIPEVDREQLFEKFTRLGSVEHYGGLGLGLFIVRKIAEAHGGTIELQRELKEGSRFILRLPLRDSESSPAAG